MDSFLLVTPHPSPSIVAPPTSAPLLQLVNLPALLDDSDVPTFLPLLPSAGARGVTLPSAPDTFFLATPLEIRHEATRSGANVVSPPPTPPRFHLRMRPSSPDDIFDHQMSAPSTPSPLATNRAPQAHQAVTPTKGMAATELSVGPNLPDLAVTKDLSAETASMTQPKIVAVATKKRKMMRRNASFNALCA